MQSKKLLGLLLGMGLTAGVYAQSIRTELDGRVLNFDQPAMMQGGRVMVPLRGIFESLGADVLYDAARRSIKATKGDRVIELSLGSRDASINGQTSYLDVPADSMGGRVMVPLRFVSEALGADVKWSASTRTVSLSSSGGAAVEPDYQSNNNQQNAGAPNISRVNHNGRQGMQPGDSLVVTLAGDPGGQASFDIPGVTQNVPMQEQQPGRYQGTYTVRSGLQIATATVIGKLQRNGRETVEESRRPVSFLQNGQVNVPGGAATFDVSPLPGSQTASRPAIQVRLNGALRQGSARLFLDGQDVTQQAQIGLNSLDFTPQYDLNPGEHRVRVQATDAAGRMVNRDWTFQSYGGVNNNPNPMNPDNTIPTVILNNLINGGIVPAIFSVQGQTKPFSQVRVVADARRDLIPGWISLQNFSRTSTAQADQFGRFNVQMDASQLPPGTPITLQIQATDAQGRSSGITPLSVRRQ